MKAFRLIGMAIVAMSMSFASCSNEEVVAPENPQEENYVTLGLGCTGEFLEFSESNMGRAATDELYGIQVYELTPIYMHDNPETGEAVYSYQETPYAYGMFTSLTDVKIRLLEGNKYKFKVSIVVEPLKNIADDSFRYLWFGEYYDSFTNHYGTEFSYGTKEISITEVYEQPWVHQYNHDRYYGELDMYTPQENSSVEIETKRVSYGVKYITTGLGDNESLKVEILKDVDRRLYAVDLTSDPNEGIYTFESILSVWNTACRDEIYTNEKKLTISWNKADGTVVPMGTYAVTFKRNVMTTIKINAENLNLDNGIKVFKEETSMVPDETIYEINGGKVTEVPVIPGN